MINVTKTYLPPFEEYTAQLRRAWDKGWITNNGELVQELEAKLREYLGVQHLLFCSNGTIVLQMAIKALGLTKEIITTPFSYVATANAIAWEGCTPVFADIEPDTFTIDPQKIEAAITEDTQAILATHVYGFPCKIEAIQAIANKHGLKVIYDGAHAFGCRYKGQSLLHYGDISTCSFHATKVFHTVEGGCVITNDDFLYEKLFHSRQFGHFHDEYFQVGINGKNSELHAAMGICNLKYFSKNIQIRAEKYNTYIRTLSGCKIKFPGQEVVKFKKHNFAYFPVLFPSHELMISAFKALNEQDIHPRRYFYPALNTLPFLNPSLCSKAMDISNRILCLPFYESIEDKEIYKISKIINSVL